MMAVGVVLAVSVLFYQGQYKRLEDEERHLGSNGTYLKPILHAYDLENCSERN